MSAEVRAAALELQRGGRALILATAPGREDLAAIRRLRTTLGARVRVAYLTNGESTIRGPHVEYPNQVAARLRESAASACEILGAEHAFLNLPSIGGVSRTEALSIVWPDDSLRSILRRELADFTPDLVLVNGLERPESPDVVGKHLRTALQRALADMSAGRRWSPSVIVESVPPTSGAGRQTETRADTLVRRAEEGYASWRDAVPADRVAYASVKGVSPSGVRATADVTSLLRRTTPRALATIDSAARSFGARVASWRRLPTGTARQRTLLEAVELLGQIDRTIAGLAWGTSLERRMLLDWRAALETVRVEVLGVRAFWSVTERELTSVQLTTITVDSVKGTSPKGETLVYFPMVQKGWIVNESVENNLPLAPGEPFRIISPKSIEFDLPREINGLTQRRWRTPWYFFIVHRSPSPEQSFSYRLDAGFLGVPRFAVDVLTPMTMAARGESVVVRLTNNSRDGVRDQVSVRHHQVRSESVPFRLNAKGMSSTDTLTLDFSNDLSEGTHLAEIAIGSESVGRFVVRKFPVEIDSTITVGVLGGLSATVTGSAVRRTGMRALSLDPAALSATDLAGSDVAVVPEWGGQSLTADAWKALDQYVRGGKHLVVMAQFPAATSALPQSPIRRATVDGSTDSLSEVTWKDLHAVGNLPNDLQAESWEGWIGGRVPHRLTLREAAVDTLATVGPAQIPAVLRWRVGDGMVTYVNLNLQHQFLNVLPVAYRLLANVLAQRP